MISLGVIWRSPEMTFDALTKKMLGMEGNGALAITQDGASSKGSSGGGGGGGGASTSSGTAGFVGIKKMGGGMHGARGGTSGATSSSTANGGSTKSSVNTAHDPHASASASSNLSLDDSAPAPVQPIDMQDMHMGASVAAKQSQGLPSPWQ